MGNRLFLKSAVCGIALTLFGANSVFCDGRSAEALRPLSTETVLYRSPDPLSIYVAPAGLVVFPDGRIVAAVHSVDRSPESSSSVSRIYTSDDGGETWVERAERDIGMCRMFIARGRVHIIGKARRGNVLIARSDDRGETWTPVTPLKDGDWRGAPINVLVRENHVYLSMDERIHRGSTAWPISELAPYLFRGDLDKDLLDPSSWTFSSPVKSFIDYFNDQELNTLFGIPFYPSFYPERYYPAGGRRRSASPLGWTEGNVVQITDPQHLFYDPSGRTFHILLRANTGLPNIGAILKVTENEDGTMTTSLEKAPSGKEMVFLAIPGGQQTFHIMYDEQTRLYWKISTQNTDSMTQAQFITRFGMAYDERVRLQLHFSKNLFDWVFAGLAAMGETEDQARQAVAMAIDGDDLIFTSRSGDKHARSAHDCNLVLFHRIKDFRSLAY